MDFLTPLFFVSTILGQAVDSDRDGLPDEWEINGFGPIDPKKHGCDPQRSDLFLIFKPRNGVKRSDLDATVARIVKFYADLEHVNPDGSKGMHAIPIILEPLTKEQDRDGYKELYEVAMPKEWRGIGHGVLVEVSQGGGGQTNRPDWCGSSNRWETIVHELGHQFGLDHGPKGGQTGSPYHTSLMNYDYSYSFDGDAAKVHYSTGMFKDLRMKETDLDENLNYSSSDLSFLTKRPYYFKIQPDGETKTKVDWNRNGVFGETHVRADVNDGYALELRGNSTEDLAAGSPALVALGESLAVVTPVLLNEDDYQSRIWNLSDERPGTIKIALYQNGKKASELMVPIEKAAAVTGDVSAVSFSGRIWVAAKVKGGFGLYEIGVVDGKPALFSFRKVDADKGEMTVVATPNGVRLVRWNSATGAVYLGDWLGERERIVPGLTSTTGIGAAWNAKRAGLAVTETVNQGKKVGRVRIAQLGGTMERGFAVKDRIWVEGVGGNFSTADRPILLFDDSSDRGPKGGYLVYVRSMSKPQSSVVSYIGRQIEDPSMNDGWRVKMVGNEWANGMNLPGACFYRGDIAYAYRLGFGDGIQKISLSLNASGIEDRWLADFDEVSYIFETGLAESLGRVQKEVGIGK
jgi:hypothetical protein